MMEHNSRGGKPAGSDLPPRRPSFVDVSVGGNVDVDERRSRLLARLNQIDLEKTRLASVQAAHAPSSAAPSREAVAAAAAGTRGGSAGGGGTGDGRGGGMDYPVANTMDAEHPEQHSSGAPTLPAALPAAAAAAAAVTGAVGYPPAASPVLSARATTGTDGALPSYGHHGSYDPLRLIGSGAALPGGVDEAAARSKARPKKGMKKSRSGRAARGSVAAGGVVGAPAFGGRQASYCSRLIKDMLRIKDASSFSKPITSIWTPEQLPGYLDIVKRPMDLGTVLQNLHDGLYHTLPPSEGTGRGGGGEGTEGAAVQTAGDAMAPDSRAELTPFVAAAKEFDPAAFAADVRLVFQNALAYNTPGDPFHTAATRLLGRFEDKFGSLPDVDAPPDRRRPSGTKSGTKSEPVDAASSRARHSTRKRSAPEELSRATRGGHDGVDAAAKVPRRGANGDVNSGVADSRNRDAQRPLVDSSPARRASGAGRSAAPASKRVKKRRVDHRSGGGRGRKGVAAGAAVGAAVEESVMSGSAVQAVERQSAAVLERELLNLRSRAAAAGDKSSVTALRDVPMTYEGKVELSINVNQLPSEQLQKLVALVARSTSASFPVNEEQEIELDIDSLDNHTLRDMEAMIFATLLKGRKQPSKAQLTALRKEIAIVQARLEEAKMREAAEAAAAPPPLPPLSGGEHAGAAASGGPPKRRPRAPRSFLSSSSSGSGSSSSSRGSGSSSSGSSTGSSSSSGSGASGSSRRRLRALAVADKHRLAAAITRPSPAASTTAAAAVPLYPTSGFSRMAGATLAAARSPVSEFRPGGRPPAYAKPSGGGSPGEALIGAAAAAETLRECPSDEEGKAAGPTGSPTSNPRQHGGADIQVPTSGVPPRLAVAHRDGGSQQRPVAGEKRCRSGGGGELQPPTPTPEHPGPCGGTRAALPPHAASGRPPRALPLRSEDDINIPAADSGGEVHAGSCHSSEPPRPMRDERQGDRPTELPAEQVDAGRHSSARATDSGDRYVETGAANELPAGDGSGAAATSPGTLPVGETAAPPRVGTAGLGSVSESEADSRRGRPSPS